MIPTSLVRAVLDWPVVSQQHARRNALVASTRLTQQRHDRLEVEEYLEAHQRRWAARTGTAETSALLQPALGGARLRAAR